MAKIKLTEKDKIHLIEAINKGVEPSPDLLPKLFPGTAEKFDVQELPTPPYNSHRGHLANNVEFR